MAKYHLHITGSDSLGLNFIENIIRVANQGATLKEKTIPNMRFPHSISMVLETDEVVVPSACVRVFHYDSNKEVYATFVAPKAAEFSTDEDVKDYSLNDEGVPWTKEQLDAMEWESEFKAVCKSAGITGRSRDKMTKEYLAWAEAYVAPKEELETPEEVAEEDKEVIVTE